MFFLFVEFREKELTGTANKRELEEEENSDEEPTKKSKMESILDDIR